MPQGARSLFSLLFFLSGAAGLVYEVCWTRLLILPMGSTVYSMTAVLTAFMGGLALGAFLAGRWIDRHGRPLRVYALLELGIGAFCLVLPWVVQAEQPLFRWVYQNFATSFLPFHLFKFFACGVVILVPATLMGATLPVLCRYFMDDAGRIGNSLGWLYAVNAFGAVAGSLLAGFVLIPQLGLRGAMLVGVGTSLSVAAIAWLAQSRFPAHSASRGEGKPEKKAAPPRPSLAATLDATRQSTHVRVLLLGYGLSGLAAMLFQIAWTRVLVLVVGSSVYALALVVSAFILGLAVGSSIASRVADRLRNPSTAFALAELGIGFTALAMVPVFQSFPEWMLRLVPQLAQDFWRFQLVQFALIFVALLLPTACMGMCLPLVGRALLRGVEQTGATVGTAYSANTVGTIVGAFCGGFVLLPHLGVHRTILLGALLNIGVAAAILSTSWRRRLGGGAAAAVVAAGVLTALLLPRFDPLTLTSGAFLYADRYRQAGGQTGSLGQSQGRNLGAAPDRSRAANTGQSQERRDPRSLAEILRQEYSILLFEEGLNSTITVKESPSGGRYLAINGKVDGSDDKDMSTQVLSGHVSCLLHPEPHDVAVIGLATGVTLHSVAQYPSVRRIDCIEIVPEMAKAARLFAHVNGDVLDDPRLHLVMQDARNHLSLTRQTYDLIISEPSNPWMAGVASLYTREFLTSCRDRLLPRGTMMVFLHLYSMDLTTFRGLIRTFQSVFPQTSLWETAFGSDYVLLGAKDELQIEWRELVGRLARPAIARDLARVGMHDAGDFLQTLIAGPDELRHFAAEGIVYTDDHNRLEFDAPRSVYRHAELGDMKRLHDLRAPGLPPWLHLPPEGLTDAEQAMLQATEAAQGLFWQGLASMSRGRALEATSHFIAALEQDPWVAGLAEDLVESARSATDAMVAARDTSGAIALYERIVRLNPDLPEIQSRLGYLLGNAGRLAEAEVAYRHAVSVQPRNVSLRSNLALAMARQGEFDEAATQLQAVLAQRPQDFRAHYYLATLHLETGDLAQAEKHGAAATQVDPQAADGWLLLGEVLCAEGEGRRGAEALERARSQGAPPERVQSLLADCDAKRRTGS